MSDEAISAPGILLAIPAEDEDERPPTNSHSMENGRPNSQLRWFFLTVALIALAYRILIYYSPAAVGQKWDINQVTIKGFRAGVTREQVEARLGPGQKMDGGWSWYPQLPPFKPGGTLPVITFEGLELVRSDHRWLLIGSQFEYRGQKFITQIHCADSIWQGTVQGYFGRGNLTTQYDQVMLRYRDPGDTQTELSFAINNIDEFGPNFTRAVVVTSLSWPDTTDSIRHVRNERDH